MYNMATSKECKKLTILTLNQKPADGFFYDQIENQQVLISQLNFRCDSTRTSVTFLSQKKNSTRH